MAGCLKLILLVKTVLALFVLVSGQGILQDYATGPDVVEAVVRKVHESCVFAQDHLLLRRLAYVESRDGTDADTFRPGFSGGIWQVSQEIYNHTKSSPSLEKLRQYIDSSDPHINWSRTSWQDLLKPLYSGLAAALYIEDTLRGQARPISIQQQQKYWEGTYHRHTFVPDPQKFIERANLMESGCTHEVVLDIVFILDTSSSISQQDFKNAQEFIISIPSIFDFNHLRIALITYSSTAILRFGWDEIHSQNELNATVSKLNYTTGGTETAEALKLAGTLFSTARPGAAQVLVLITDGESHDTIDTANAARALKIGNKVKVITVGVGLEVNPTELDDIASEPFCVNTFAVAAFDQIDAIREDIQRTTCMAPVFLQINDTANCSLSRGCPPYTVPIDTKHPVVIKTSTTCGNNVTLYGSYITPYPKQNASDAQLTVISYASGKLRVPNPASQGMLYYLNANFSSETDKTCVIIITPVLRNVHVSCTEDGISIPCTKQDITDYNPDLCIH